MAKKIYKFTEEELKAYSLQLVMNSIKGLDNVQIVEDEPTKIESGDFSPEQYNEAMQVMSVNRGAGDEPKVGIFWYNVAQKQLFGVVTHKRTDYLKPNAGGGLITCTEMHEDVWKKSFTNKNTATTAKDSSLGSIKTNHAAEYSIHLTTTNTSLQ